MPETFGGYTVDQLEEAFKRIQNPQDWKAPISATIDQRDFDLMFEAVVHYTATTLEIVQDFGNGKVKVHSIGYRMGPAGP